MLWCNSREKINEMANMDRNATREKSQKCCTLRKGKKVVGVESRHSSEIDDLCNITSFKEFYMCASI